MIESIKDQIILILRILYVSQFVKEMIWPSISWMCSASITRNTVYYRTLQHISHSKSSSTYHKKCPTAAIILTAGFHYEKVSLYVCSKKSDAYM